MISLLEAVPLQWYLIASLCVIAIVSYIYGIRNQNFWAKKGITGPKPFPVLGNMVAYFFNPMPDIELSWYRKYGKIFGLYFGNDPVLSVAEPELIKQVLVKDFNSFRNRRQLPSNHKVLSKHMFVSRDENWKRIRAISSPAFTSGKLKKMYSLIQECCDDFMTSLDKYATNKQEINLKQQHGAFTMDVIARCAFGTKTNTHTDPNNEFTKNAIEFFNFKMWKILIMFALPSFLGKIFRPILIGTKNSEFFINVGRHLIKQRKQTQQKYNDFFQLLMDVERNDEVFGETDEFAMNHLNEGKDEIKANNKAFSNVLEKKLTEDEILAQCFLFFIAGFETTGSTLSFLSYELALHPEIQEKLFEEIKPIFNGSKVSIDYETILRLPFLDSVFSETLRKYPPVLRLERQAMDDVVLGDTGIVVPKGTLVEIPVYAIQYDPENFPNPNEFIPERFMPSNRSNIKPYTYLPFGTGPRNCIGMRFALLEAKLAIVNIVSKYRFYKTANTDIPLQMLSGRRPIGAKRLIVGIEKR